MDADRINFIQYDPTAPPASSYFSPSRPADPLHAGGQFLIRRRQGLHRVPDHAPAIVYDPATGEVIKGPFR